MAVTTRSKFWGPHFPDVWDVAGKVFWGPHFPDPGPELDLVTPVGPDGVATFVLDLDAEMSVTFGWQTDIFKAHDGTERRASVLDHPRRAIRGSALLIGGPSVRTLRSELARYAAQGATFLLGLPFESITLSADSAGAAVAVPAGALASCDWANPGQRVVVVGTDRTAVKAVVQSASGTTITLDVAPGSSGKAGARIMPLVAVLLDPQQGFARYRNAEGFERWSIVATAATFGWQTAAVKALLRGSDTGAGSLDDVSFQALTAGAAGNNIRIEMNDDALLGVEITEVGNDLTIAFQAGISTMGDLATALQNASTLVSMIGIWDPSAVLQVTDQFAFMNLSGGSDGAYADDGAGAVVATHGTRPVFDRRLVVDDTADDSLQAMNEVIDLGGIPASVGQATAADWGRQIALRDVQGPSWQWLKKLLATVRGGQKSFWLPSWRDDLKATASGVNTLTIEGPDDEDGGFFAWYPTRADIQIVQADGTITRATITAATDNGDGTITLTIGVTLSASPITQVSWLELCRLESDEVSVSFVNHLFAMQATARVVTQ